MTIDETSIPDYATCIYRAEASLLEIMRGIVEAACGAKAGVIGEAPPNYENFAVAFTSPEPDDAAFWSAHTHPLIACQANIVGAFRTRADAQVFLALIFGGLPYSAAAEAESGRKAGFIKSVRVREISAIQNTSLGSSGGTAQIATVLLDVLFETGNEGNE